MQRLFLAGRIPALLDRRRGLPRSAIFLKIGSSEVVKSHQRVQKTVKVPPKQQAKLGDTDVVLVESTDEIPSLYTLVINLLEQNGARFNTPAFIKDGYVPHFTIQKSGELQKIATITELSLIDMFPVNDWHQRKVVATFDLST
jgi:hypothetical protein